jgi:hypothetical protein
VTVVSTSRLMVVPKMSRARWPSSPSARSCSCLHRESNAKAVSKKGVAARSHVPMASASCVARGGRRASRRARSWGRRSSGRRARARVRLQHALRSLSLARAAAGPTESCARCMRGCPQSGGHTCGWRAGVPGLEEVGDKVDRGVDRLARALVPRRVYCDGSACVLCVQSGVCGGAFVLIFCGGWEKRAGLGRRSHLELEQRLHLEL